MTLKVFIQKIVRFSFIRIESRVGLKKVVILAWKSRFDIDVLIYKLTFSSSGGACAQSMSIVSHNWKRDSITTVVNFFGDRKDKILSTICESMF